MATSLTARFGLDAKGLKTELKQVRREINNVVSNMVKLGAGVALAGFVGLGKSAIDLGSKLSDLAVQLGINVEKLQVLNSISRDAGVPLETLSKSLVKVRTSAQEAAEGNKTYADAFATLGINVEKFLALPAEERLAQIGRAYATSTDKNAAYNAVAGIFGERVGPKMIEVLGVLANTAFPNLEKAAKESGDVMSASTIAALDEAGDAIEAFKQRAIIAIGNIIVNFRSEEGLKLLWLQLSKVVVTFAAKMVDAITYPARVAGNVIGAAFDALTAKFRNGLIDGLIAVANKMNQVLPDSFQINVAGIEELKVAGGDVSDAITRAIADTEPAALTTALTTAYDELIEKQKAVIRDLAAALNPPAKPPPSPPPPGKNPPANDPPLGSGTPPPVAAPAAKKFFGVMFDALTSETIARMTDAEINKVVTRARRQLQELTNPALNPNFDSMGSRLSAAGPQAELQRALAELSLRRDVRRTAGTIGEDRAFDRFDGLSAQRFEEILRGADATSEQTRLLKELNQKINHGITVRSLEA